METVSLNPRVDDYFGKARPFAQPILWHLRELIHKGCPGVVETIKWSRPFFEYKGVILCNIAAFNEHCSFGFWGEEIGAVLREASVLKDGAMGSLGRITTRKDLPSDKLLISWIRHAKTLINSGQYTSPIAARHKVVKAPKAPAEVPGDFTTALEKNKTASRVFADFSPSCNVNTSSGLPMRSVPKPEENGSRLLSSGSQKASNATGSIRSAD